MHRAREDDFGLGALHDLAGIHDRHLVGPFRDDAEIVRDEQDRHAEPLLQLADQLQDLRLDGDVERGRRFVGDQELGRAGERHRDHDPLALPAGELVRIACRSASAASAILTRRSISIARSRASRRLGALMQPHGFRDLIADRHDRVERGHRLLEDHRDLVAADAAHLLLRKAGEILAAIEQLAADDAAGALGEQPDDRERGHALAAAGLADQPERLAILDVEGDAVDRAHLAVAGEEGGAQVVDPQERRHSGISPVSEYRRAGSAMHFAGRWLTRARSSVA